MKLRITVFTVIFILPFLGVWELLQAGILPVSGVADSAAVNEFVGTKATFPDMTYMVVKMLISLAGIGGLIVGFIYLLKRFIFNRNNLPAAQGRITVLNTSYLAPKKSIHLVKVINRVLVVGVTEQSITTLSEFNGEDAEPLLKTPPEELKKKSFSRYFSDLMHKENK